MYLAAQALGIDVVVLDNPGHWLKSGRYKHWRKAFIPTKLVQEADPKFTGRIVAFVKSYDKPIQGAITFCDKYQVNVTYIIKLL